MKHAGSSILAVLVFLAVSPCWARIPCGSIPQYGNDYVYLSCDSTGDENSLRIIDSAPALRKVYVFVSTSGATAVEFSAPLPNCLIGATYLSETNVFPLTMGNLQNGVSISFGGCLSGSAIHVLTVNVLMQGLTEDCCHWLVLPHPTPGIPGTTNPLFVGCPSGWIQAMGFYTLVVDQPGTKLDTPSPPDGANNQPLDAKLSWTQHRCDWAGCTESSIDVYFGTSPDPPLVARLNRFPYEFPHDPGPLQPSTTYYWKLMSYGADDPWVSPVWSFTTGTGTPTQSTSWGAIKALYRE